MSGAVTTRIARFVLVLLACVVLAPAQARQSAAQTAPGRYADWGPDIDQVEIFRTFRLGDYERVVVEPFATDGVALPPAEDNTYTPVKSVLERFTPLFVAGLRDGRLAQPVEGAAASSSGAHALRLRGKVVLLDPGSRAKRYWGGFGAGAVRVEIRCEVVDGASGEVLLAFSQQRRSGFGGFGGGYEELMERTVRQIAGDTARLLQQF